MSSDLLYHYYSFARVSSPGLYPVNMFVLLDSVFKISRSSRFKGGVLGHLQHHHRGGANGVIIFLSVIIIMVGKRKGGGRRQDYHVIR